jgi:geranylgeranyl pyrophosphate synthase
MSDDVEDDSVARRGKPCVHKIFGVDTAVNTGAIMYFWPIAKIINNEFNLTEKQRLAIYDLYATEMIRVSSGQAWDIEWHHGGYTPNEKQYLNMCLCKTGVLTRFACQLGAIIGGATKEQYDALGDFGQIVGVGFQIQDDILELTEADFKKGKGSIGGDIHEGKRTLIVIRTLEKANEKDKKRLIEILDSHATDEKIIQEALDIINKYDGIEYSKKKAEELVLKGWAKADKVLKESNAKTMLKKFAEHLVNRKV